MQIYSTILPIKETLTPDILIRLVIEWNQGSPNNKMNNLNWDGQSRNVRFEDGRLSLAIEEVRAHNIVAIRFHQLDKKNVIWNTDIVVNFNTHIFSIKLDRETTVDTMGFIPHFKPPILINLLIKRGYIAMDRDLPIGFHTIPVTDAIEQNLEKVIRREADYKMPVIYVTRHEYGYLFNIEDLAYRLRGVAHVLKEENTDVTAKLCAAYGSVVPSDGDLGIYYPNNTAAHRIISVQTFQGNEKSLIDRIVMIVCRYVNQQARDKMMTWEGVQNEILRLQYKSAAKKKEMAENEVKDVYNNFQQKLKESQKKIDDLYEIYDLALEENEEISDQLEQSKNEIDDLIKTGVQTLEESEKISAELEEKKREIEELNYRIMALQAENQALRAKDNSESGKPVLYAVGEEDLYDGEICDHLLEILKEHLKNIPANTRKEHIICDILDNNTSTGRLEIKRKTIKKLLKGYVNLNDSLKRDLREFGFVINKEGKHYKLTYKGDARYMFTFSSSASDSQHGGGNMASQIINKIL